MTRLHRIAPLAVAGVLLLSGCGENAGTPGAAATIDGKTFSMADVDEVAGLWCDFAEDDIRESQEQGAVGMSELKKQVATWQVLGYAAREVADDRGVVPDSSYEEAVKSNRAAVDESHLDDEEAETLLPVLNEGAYIQSIATEIGMQELGDAATGDNADPTQQPGQVGGQIILDWLLERDPKFSPELDLAFAEDGTLEPADTSLSVAVSDFAKIPVGNANPAIPQAQPDLSYLDELPANQVCGESR